MAEHRRSGKLAVILHADIAGSTGLVKQDEHLAHERIQETFQRFSNTITKYHGRVRELRGDAILAEFERASGAVSAALAFQVDHKEYITSLNDPIQPIVRVGIAMGEVVIADKTITGEGVVLAQRLEQLAEPGGVVIQGAACETIPGRFPFEYENLGEQEVKGFNEPIRVYSARLRSETDIPEPEQVSHRLRNTLVAFVFVAIVAVGIAVTWFKPWEVREEPASVVRKAFPLPDKPSIAVLAFDNLSGDPTQEYLSDGISESIITGLSHFPEFFVVARQSAFSYKGKAFKVQQVAEELGVQYILEGSVQRSDDKVRVTVQLIDAITGHHLWAERYDREWEDIFALQDDITQHIIATISSDEGPIEKALRQRAKQKAPTDLRAYDYFLLGRSSFFRVTGEDNVKARELFQKATQLDPNYSLVHVWIAWTHLLDFTWGWSDTPVLSGELAFDHAQKAVALDTTTADGHWVLGSVLINIKGQPEAGLAEYEQALALNPNNADLIAEYGWALPRLGRAEEGIEFIEKAMRLNPVHPDWYRQALMFALYNARRYQEVIAVADTLRVRLVDTYLVLAGSHAQLGQLDNAHELAAKVMEMKPDFSLRSWREIQIFAHPVDLEHYIDGLQKAGLPEDPLL